MKRNIVLLHRQMARDAQREAKRRASGRKPIGLSDRAIEYLTRANPLAWISRTMSMPEPTVEVRVPGD